MAELTRRTFLKSLAAGAGAVASSDVLALDLLAPVTDPLGDYPYRGWEDLYRDQWSFDYAARSTHSVNCTGSCTWKIYVKDGVAFKEEQYGDLPNIGSGVPSYNPRGCQKGANFLEYVYGPQRLKYPLIRTGARGEGKWRRASWDEALAMIANHMTEAIDYYGPDTVTFFSAIPAKHFITFAGGARLANLVGGVLCSFYDWYCDLPPGEPITWGVQTDSAESADWVNSKYLLLWGSNVAETRIPDAHFITEARMRGAKVVTVFPEYNPTAVHADLYVPVNPGTDAALALGMAHVIVSEGLYDSDYVRRYTDLPLLVRSDNGKFLRESDLISGGQEDRFYFWDGEGLTQAPGSAGSSESTLDLGSTQPALTGTYTADTLSGSVEVRPVFERLRDSLDQYPPSTVAGTTGVDAGIISQMAREFAAASPARIIEGAGTNHYYHNDLINRAQILLVALTGNVGKPGGGFDHYVGQEKIWPSHGFGQVAFPLSGDNQRFQNTTLWTYTHGEVGSDVDTTLPRPLSEYIRTSVDNGWMPLYPEGTLDTGKSPRVMLIWGANFLNQTKGYEDLVANLWPKLDLVVDVNTRMDTTAQYADVVLPAASFYEKWDLSSTDLHTYIHPFTPAVPPLYESRTDWQIWQGLARALQDTGYSYYDDEFGITRDFSTLLADFTDGGGLADDKAAAQAILDHSPETEGMTMDGLDAQPERFKQTGDHWTSDLIAGQAYYGFQRMHDYLQPLPTVTGRQQFYIDEPWFMELGEALPAHKAPLDVDDYPLRWVTPHSRWSMHSTWRDSKAMLRLQRGQPVVSVSPGEAAARNLADNDTVKVYNTTGSLVANLYVSPRMPDGMILMYHGWERFQMKAGGFQSPTTIRIKPTQLVGGYGHLFFNLNYWGPTGNQKDTLVEIRKHTG